ncbi:tetratricopeptide repeat protein [Kineococcus rubinsiae]|uniref:tetratricopeptide repeat protein n=1 Tax=Kineococcus rubinsiae TaxID=2609562 RepID=UPI00143119BC|nr:tetratricopeptide repeat protein [Kineococcus rubinsiae]NIZ90716.1 tetratricopeptide repeat protein [Kineococcus rubinsiae]
MSAADFEDRLAAVWDGAEDVHEEEVVLAVEALVAELPAGDPVGRFELASAHDYAGHEDQAVPLYRAALDAGLEGERRRQAVVQLASSLRLVGDPAGALQVLRENAPRPAGDDAIDDDESADDADAADDEGSVEAHAAFEALALVDLGRDREAVTVLLAALAPHAAPYDRAVLRYAEELPDPPEGVS